MTHPTRSNTDVTAEELMAELEADPEWVARRDAREQERQRRIEEYDRVAAPLKAELAKAGFEVESVADLYNKPFDYREAIPILLEWLPRIENRDVKESVVRALTVKWAKPDAAPVLVEEFRRAEDSSELGLRWAIGNALAEVADDSVFEETAALAEDRRFGRSREMVALALGNMKDPRAVEILRGLLADEDVAGHAVIALGKLRAEETRVDIEPFLKHPKAWVRKEASRALKRSTRG